MNDENDTNTAARGADWRLLIRTSLEAGDLAAVTQGARALLSEQSGVANFRLLRQIAEAQPKNADGLKPFKLALLSSFSIEFLHDALIAFGFANGLRVEIYQAGYGQIRQEIFDRQSGLYAFAPDVVILAVEGEDWLPEIYVSFMDADAAGGSLDAASDRFREDMQALARAFRTRSNAPLLVNNLAQPRLRRAGIADMRLVRSQLRVVSDLNQRFGEALATVVDTHLVDYAGLVNRFGTGNWYDARMRLYAKAPIAGPMLGPLAQEYMRYFRALRGLAKKCLVVDLDNTLWGGVIGEDGLDGIHLGANYPGSAFVEFQRAVLDLQRRGVILAIASKNNAADVDAVFDRHTAMVLRKEHFAEAEIHWEPKSESIRRIAGRLKIGLGHMVFVDDNPAEIEHVRRELPMVTVIQLPRRAELYVDALTVEGLFDTLSLSDEDRRRGELYQQRAQAESMRSASTSIEDYYRDLDMELCVAPVDAGSLPRAAQLTQKTNQFNVTTFRYSEAEVAARMAAPDWVAVTVGVRDRFGDNGIVGLMMAREDGNRLDIDTFLLSCRVIGRTVETAMLATLYDAARKRGLAKLTGRLIPSEKNVPVRDLFERHGFVKTGEDAAGASAWEYDVAKGVLARPVWFRDAPSAQ